MSAPGLTYDPGIWPLVAAAALSALLATWIWPRRHVPGGRPLIASLLLYSAGLTIRSGMLCATSFELQLALQPWWAITVALGAVASLWRSLEYAGLVQWLRRPLGLAVTLLPSAVLCVLYLTNPLHHWLWTAVWNDGGLRSSLGPAGYAGAAWGLALFLASIAVSARVAFLSQGPLRRQATVLTLGTVIGLLGGTSQIAWNNGLHETNAAHALWLIAAALVAIALFRMRAVDLSPIPRHTVVEHMADGVLVLDERDRVVDANPALARLFAVSPSSIIGERVDTAFRATPELASLLVNGQDAPRRAPPATSTIRAGPPGAPVRDIEVQLPAGRAAGPTGSKENAGGRIVLCRDVTELRVAQASLERQRVAMAALQERERLARELHDGLAQVLAFAKLRVQLATDALDQDRVADARTDLDGVGQVLQMAHEEVRDFLLSAQPGRRTGQHLAEQIADFVAGFAGQHPFTVNTIWRSDPAGLQLDPETQVQVVRIIQESLVNSQRHSGAATATLEFERKDGALHVTVRDEGTGFEASTATEGRETGHYGLRFMRERAETVGGTLQITSQCGCGTVVHLTVPVTQ